MNTVPTAQCVVGKNRDAPHWFSCPLDFYITSLFSSDFSVFAVDMKVDQDRKNRTQRMCGDMEVMGMRLSLDVF